jgi:sugar transferase (PEP-CTERM system associated)
MHFLKLSMITAGAALFVLDAVIALLGWHLALWAGWPGPITLRERPIDVWCIVYPVADLLVLYAMGLYRREAILETRNSLTRVPLVVGMGAAVGLLLTIVLPELNPALFARLGGQRQALTFAFAGLCFTCCAFFARLVLSVMLRRRVLRRHLLVVGAGQRAWDLLWMLSREGSNLQYDIAFHQDPAFGKVDPRLARDPTIRILLSHEIGVLEAAKAIRADEIVVAPDERRGMDLRPLLECKKAGFPIVQYLSFIEKEIRRVDLKRMDLGWIVYSEGFYFGLLDRFLKRLFDLTAAAAVLLPACPFLLAAMIAIRWEGRGPVFYRQQRVTQNDRPFWMLKLRTMRVDAEAGGAVWAAAKDDRITRVGSFLRRTRIDELPQLFNVLKGDMSFVGPRPERPQFVAELAKEIPLYNERHMVKAGLTGWAQINYPYGASVDDARSKLSYDLYYVKNFSILFDIVILLQTIRVVLWPSGVR